MITENPINAVAQECSFAWDSRLDIQDAVNHIESVSTVSKSTLLGTLEY